MSIEMCIRDSSIPSGLCIYQVHRGRLYPQYHNPAFYEVLGYNNTHITQVREQVTFIGIHEDDRAEMCIRDRPGIT